MALIRDGGQGLMRFLAETKFADGAELDVWDLRKELTVECPGIRISSDARVVQDCLKLGKGRDQSILTERMLRLTTKWKPSDRVYVMKPLW